MRIANHRQQRDLSGFKILKGLNPANNETLSAWF